MAAFDIFTANAPRAHKTNAVVGFLASIRTALVAWNDQRQTRNALNELTDRELADIGLIRGDIESVARKF